MRLPDSYRWNDAAEASYLYQNYACRAVVTAAEVKIKRSNGPDVLGRCSGVAQGKRHVERWLCGIEGPYSRRARRERVVASMAHTTRLAP